MSAITTSIANGLLTIKVQGYPPIIIDPAELSADLVAQAALHGFKQKYCDKAALGADATLAEKYASIRRMVEWHADGCEWNMVAAGDGSSGDSLLARALQDACNLDRDAAREAVAKMDKKTQAAMRASPELAPIISRLKAERATPKVGSVDAAGILAGLRRA
jgi:hypothetical protein